MTPELKRALRCAYYYNFTRNPDGTIVHDDLGRSPADDMHLPGIEQGIAAGLLDHDTLALTEAGRASLVVDRGW